MSTHEVTSTEPILGQETIDNNSILDDLYNYFKENVIASFLLIINFFGVTCFLIYFVKIDYIPNLDFSGTLYLLIVMSLIGLFLSIFLYFILILPSIIWNEGVLLSFNDTIVKNKPLNNINFIIMIVLSSISIYIITISIDSDLNKILSFFGLIWIYSSVTRYLISPFNIRNYFSKENLVHIFKISVLYFMLSTILLFPMLVIYLLSGNQQFSIEFLMLAFIALVVNLSILQKKLFFMLFSIFIFFLGLFFINPGFVPTLVIQKLHIGDFNATVRFKNDYCQTLKSFNIPLSNENKNSCSSNIDNVLWRVGKESLLKIGDKDITVPSDQIISMTWPMITRKPKGSIENNTKVSSIISFEFNSTNLTKNGKKELIRQINILDKNTTKVITIYGCSSPEGTDKFNRALSMKRAEKTQAWIDGYLARGKHQIRVNVIAEGISKRCTDDTLIKELKDHRKVVIE